MANYVLEILDGDRAGEVLPVADRTIRIGRKPGNDLVLADEKTSGVHAEVVIEGDRHVLRDLGSTNGTFLDGKRVSEIVLTPGDVVTIGRLRVKFRGEGEAAVADAGELAVRRLDAARLQKRGGSLGLVAVAAVLALGAAGWFWWQGQQDDGDGGGNSNAKTSPLVVPGNRLGEAIAACEAETGWQLRVAGVGFQTTAQAHSGSGAFLAARGEGGDAADFAVMRTQEALPVLSGRTWTVVAHVRCSDGGQVALRAVLAAANEAAPFRYRTGTAMTAADGWQRLETTVSVPPGSDRLQVEVVALLPASVATVVVDDVAIVEGGGAAPLEAKVPETNQTALGTGVALAVRSADPDNPAIVLAVLPDAVPAALQELHRADLCVLSDLGAQLACTPTERGFQLAATGVESLQFVLAADAAGGLLVKSGEQGYASAAADSQFTAQALLVGDRRTRAMLQFDTPVACRGRSGSGLYRLAAGSAKVELVLSFRAERQEALELVRQAKKKQQEGQPGEALDRVHQLVGTVPMDTEVLSQAVAVRSEILAAQADTLHSLQQDFADAKFFNTRGGFDRVAAGVDQLVALHGEHNLEDAPAARALRDEARRKLLEIDGADRGTQRERLEKLARAFTDTKQPALAQLVQRYVDGHLSADGSNGK